MWTVENARISWIDWKYNGIDSIQYDQYFCSTVAKQVDAEVYNEHFVRKFFTVQCVEAS